MKAIKLMFCFFFLITAPMALFAPNASETQLMFSVQEEQEKTTLKFAQSLEASEDYYRAITEYKRVIFSWPKSRQAQQAWLGMARCYHAGQKWQALARSCEQALLLTGWPIRERTELMVAWALALWNLGEAQEAQRIFERIPAPENLKDKEKILKAWLNLAAGDLALASRQFSNLELETFAQALKDFPKKPKSPGLAGALSAFVPGAGQLYADKPKAALGAFLVNALLVAVTIESFDEDHEVLGAGLGLLGLGFWVGNIYGAVNFVHQDNQRVFGYKDEWLAKKLNLNQNFRRNFGWSFTIPF